MWDEAEIPSPAEYIDRTFGQGGYLAQHWGKPYQPRDGQIALARAVDRALAGRTHLLSEAPTGCHAAGQTILMYDGSIKLVENIVVGDQLMGPDSEPRSVLGLARGVDNMVDIVPVKGAPWRVNEGHILTLVRRKNDFFFDVPVSRWRQWPEAVRDSFQLFRVGIHLLWPQPLPTAGRGVRIVSRTGFNVVPTGTVEPYFGFTLDRDGRFLLGDFTVTHNTGKSLAYSVPATYHAAMNKQIVVIVTANIALQEQIVKKDLPLLGEILPWAFSFGLMKGRSHYLCRAQYEHVYQSMRQQSMFADDPGAPAEDRDRLRLVRWAEREVAAGGLGDSSALDWKPSDKLWRELSVAPEDCRGARCQFADRCGALEAQRRARASQVVVTNYHMFFTNLLFWMDRGMDVILPPFDAVIFDEGHKAADIARDFFGWRVSEGSIRRLARYFRSKDPALVERIERAAGWFFGQMLDLRRDRTRYKARIVPERFSATDREAAQGLLDRLGELGEAITSEIHGLELGVGPRAREDLAIAQIAMEKLENLHGYVENVLTGGDENLVLFIEEDEFHKATIVCKLVQPAQILRGNLFGKTVIHAPPAPADGSEPGEEEKVEPEPVAVVCTSATLATESRFEFTRGELGVTQAEELIVDSPFDYERQALFIIPDICDPNDARFTSEVAAMFLRTIELARGRTLGLFTSRKRMNDVYDAVAGKSPFRLLRQDDGQRTQLIEEFKRDVHSVLLGVASFWAGVDVPGESLSCVFIDKLPFPTPDDPVLDRLAENDKRAWAAYAVPRAIIELKQGFGRLIRSDTDRGVVVCCDNRLITKGYGKQFLRALPPGMQKVKNLESIREWLDGSDAAPPPPPPALAPPAPVVEPEIDPWS
jgi:ATP-dependent DNA helicase DinG